MACISIQKILNTCKMDSDQHSDQWEVEKILEKWEQNGQILYKVMWKGFDVSEATWEPRDNLVNIEEMLARFEAQWQKNHAVNLPDNKSLVKQVGQQKNQLASKTKSNMNTRKNNIEAKLQQPKSMKKKDANLQTQESQEEPNTKKRSFNTRQTIRGNKGRKIVNKADESWNKIAQKKKERSDNSTLIKKKLQTYLQNLQAEGCPNHQKQTVKKMNSQRQKWYEDEGLTQVGIKKLKNAYFQQEDARDNSTIKDPLKIDIFLRQKRYKECDQMLKTQKQLTLRNIIDRQAGLQVQRRKIKMLEVQQAGLLESTLKNLPTANKISIICKLQMLVRSRFGWIAIGKDENNRLFMSDVNLLQQDCWRGILKEGIQS